MTAAFAIFGGANLPRHRAAIQAQADRLALITINLGEMLVVTAPNVAMIPVEGVTGLVIGALFDWAGSPVTAVPARDGAALETTDGRQFCQTFWGNYVAIWCDPERNAGRVMRDPGGALPLYRGQCHGAAIAFSDLAFVRSLITLDIAVDWTGVAYNLQFEGYPVRRTALRDIDELLPGHVGDLAPDGSAERWSPFDHVPVANASDPERAAALRTAVRASVSAHVAAHGSTALELSGGLDSSIIAGSLSALRIEWQGVTLFTRTADGDERHYARLVAARAGAPLLEVEAPDLDLLIAVSKPNPRPSGRAYLQSLDLKFAEAGASLGCDSLLSGEGGDSVFRSSGSAAAVTDAWHADGWTASQQAAFDLATLTQTDVVRVLLMALRSSWRARWSGSERFGDCRGLDPVWRQPFERHPWLARRRGVPAGSRGHIAQIVRVQALAAAVGRGSLNFCSPLLAQPVIEACLAVPSWLWIRGGRDRAFARDTFAGDLPREVAQRRSKGRLEALVMAAVTRQKASIRDMLLGGMVAASGLLDRAWLERQLSDLTTAATVDFRLLSLVDAELWARAIATLERDAHRAPTGILLD